MNALNRLFTTLTAILSTSLATAQWTQTSGPIGGTIATALVFGDTVRGITFDGEIFSYTHGTWQRTGSTSVGAVLHVVYTKNALLGTAGTGIVRSTDGGRTWINSLEAARGSRPYTDGATVVSQRNDTLYFSIDDGNSWAPGVTGRQFINGCAIDGKFLLVNTGFELHRYVIRNDTVPGSSIIDSLIPDMEGSVAFIGDLAVRDHIVYAATVGGGVQRSDDSGRTWKAMNDGLPTDQNRPTPIISLRFEGDELWGTGQAGNLFRYRNGAWTEAPENEFAYDFARTPDGIIAMTIAAPYLLDSAANKWVISSDGMRGVTPTLFQTVPGGLIASGTNRLFRTDDGGATWTTLAPFGAVRMGAGNGSIFAITQSATQYGHVVRSTDAGATWVTLDDRLPDPFAAGAASGLWASGSEVIICLSEAFGEHGTSHWVNGGLVRSTDNGETWRDISSGLPNDGFSYVPVGTFVPAGNGLLAATQDGFYRSSGHNGSWTRISPNGLPGPTLRASQAWLDGSFNGEPLARTSYAIYRSGDNGSNWETLYEVDSAGGEFLSDASVVGQDVYAVATRWDGVANTYRLIRVSANGLSVDITNTQPTGVVCTQFTADDNHVFAGTRGRSVWRMPKAPASTSDGADAARQALSQVRLEPNPTHASSRLRFALDHPSDVRIVVYDLSGNQVVSVSAGPVPAGANSVSLDANSLSPGVYVAKLILDAQTQTAMWIVE